MGGGVQGEPGRGRSLGLQPGLMLVPLAPLLTVDGEWTPWSPWSPCSEPCMGTRTRQRQCHPPQNGGRSCAMLPGGSHTTLQTRECKEGGLGWEG